MESRGLEKVVCLNHEEGEEGIATKNTRKH